MSLGIKYEKLGWHVTLGHMSAIIARLDHIEWVQRYEEHNE